MSSPPDSERSPLPTLGSIPLSAGTSVDRFVVDALIVEGTSARVYRARDALREPVALKVLRSELPRPRDAVERLAVEARAFTELQAPNVPRLVGSGRLADGAPYLALTYFEGPRLDSALKNGPMSIAGVLQLGSELGTALYDIHTKGFVHADLNPENVILCERPVESGARATGALIGFGACRRLDSRRRANPTDRRCSQFSAPEQLQGGAISAQSDVFSLGALLYQALTGQPPFTGSSAPTTVTRPIWHDPIPPIESFRPDCPPELQRAVQRALHRQPERRWPNARRFAEELAWFQAHWGCGFVRAWSDESRPSRAKSDKHRVGDPPTGTDPNAAGGRNTRRGA